MLYPHPTTNPGSRTKSVAIMYNVALNLSIIVSRFKPRPSHSNQIKIMLLDVINQEISLISDGKTVYHTKFKCWFRFFFERCVCLFVEEWRLCRVSLILSLAFIYVSMANHFLHPTNVPLFVGTVVARPSLLRVLNVFQSIGTQWFYFPSFTTADPSYIPCLSFASTDNTITRRYRVLYLP